MNQYSISKTTLPLQWTTIPSLQIEQYPWYENGQKQQTSLQLQYDEHYLYVRIQAEDKYSWALNRPTNHLLVCENSCVELFLTPFDTLGAAYFNVEVDCAGNLHFAYGEGRHNRQLSTPEQYQQIQISTSLPRGIKVESPEDTSWSAELRIPFAMLEEFCGQKLSPKQWFANFYRCGGRTEPQYATWNDIPWSQPDYHRPEFFGSLLFS